MKNTLIIGIDSATFDIILPMIQEGRLPNLGYLMRDGCWGKLQSTMPPVTPPAWVSFMTGKNPGKHGVFDFYVPPSYGYVRPVLNSKYVKAKTLWRILTEHGLKSGIINLPMTHPPEDINGFIVPGMQYSFDGKNFSHPPELMQEIKDNIGEYRVLYGDLESLYTNKLDKLLEEWRNIFEVRRKTMLYLMDKKQWDVFMPVFYSIDVMQHHFWRFFDKKHPLFDPQLAIKFEQVIPEFYDKVDTVIGELLERVSEKTTVVVVSDHGAGPEEKGFSINNWLCKEGFLSFKQSLSLLWKFKFPHIFYKILRRLKFQGISWTVPFDKLKTLGSVIDPREGINVPYFIDWSSTKAYGGNHTEQGIYINLKGREPMGIVNKGDEYYEIRETIIKRLKEIKDEDTGERLQLSIYRKEEVYNGPFIEGAPDIFVIMNDGKYIMQKEIHHKRLFYNAYKSSGTHRMEGVFIIRGEGIKQGCQINGIKIVDMAPTILYMLGLPVPEDMDGKIVTDIFEKAFFQMNPVMSAASTKLDVEAGEGVLNDDESEAVKKSLRDLGYFG